MFTNYLKSDETDLVAKFECHALRVHVCKRESERVRVLLRRLKSE